MTTRPYKDVSEYRVDGDDVRADIQDRITNLEGLSVQFEAGTGRLVIKLPTSTEGLEAGTLWNDGGKIGIVGA